MPRTNPSIYAQSDDEVSRQYLGIRRHLVSFLDFCNTSDGDSVSDHIKGYRWNRQGSAGTPPHEYSSDYGWYINKFTANDARWHDPVERVFAGTEDRSVGAVARTRQSGSSPHVLSGPISGANYGIYRTATSLYTRPGTDYAYISGLANNPNKALERYTISHEPTTGNDGNIRMWFDGVEGSVTKNGTSLFDSSQGFGSVAGYNSSSTLAWRGCLYCWWLTDHLITDDEAKWMDFDPWGPVRWVPRAMVLVPPPAGGSTVSLAGASSTTVTSAGDIDLTVSLAGSSSATVTSTGDASVTRGLAGASSTTVTTTGDLSVGGEVDIAGDSTVTVTSTGDLTITAACAGASSTTVSSTGDISITRGLAASSSTTVTSTGDLSISGSVDLAGDSNVTVTSTGDLSLTVSLAGSSSTTVTSTGDLSPRIPLAASSSTTVTSTGDISITRGLAGDSNTVVTTAADVSITRGLAGDSNVAVTTTADVALTLALAAAASTTVTSTGGLSIQGIFDAGLNEVWNAPDSGRVWNAQDNGRTWNA